MNAAICQLNIKWILSRHTFWKLDAQFNQTNRQTVWISAQTLERSSDFPNVVVTPDFGILQVQLHGSTMNTQNVCHALINSSKISAVQFNATKVKCAVKMKIFSSLGRLTRCQSAQHSSLGYGAAYKCYHETSIESDVYELRQKFLLGDLEVSMGCSMRCSQTCQLTVWHIHNLMKTAFSIKLSRHRHKRTITIYVLKSLPKSKTWLGFQVWWSSKVGKQAARKAWLEKPT